MTSVQLKNLLNQVKRIAREAGCKVEDSEGNDLYYGFGIGIIQKGFVVYSPKTCDVRCDG